MAVPSTALLGWRIPLVFRGFRQLFALRPREPHWYLSVLGTDPEHRGKGIASALLRPVLARCDAGDRVAYLEASRAENVPYYEHHGFGVIGELRMPKGPCIWRMSYAPRS